jgi:hypothetical protein
MVYIIILIGVPAALILCELFFLRGYKSINELKAVAEKLNDENLKLARLADERAVMIAKLALDAEIARTKELIEGRE